MNTTTLDPSFLRTLVLVTGFRGNDMQRAQAALLIIGLLGRDFSGADLPAEIANGSRHLAGCAVGSLVSTGLVECVGRIKSPHPNAKGRKLDLLRIPGNKVNTARAWLRANGYVPNDNNLQMEMAVV